MGYSTSTPSNHQAHLLRNTKLALKQLACGIKKGLRHKQRCLQLQASALPARGCAYQEVKNKLLQLPKAAVLEFRVTGKRRLPVVCLAAA